LFKSRAYQKNQTELVVMITPQILRRGSTGASEALPSLEEPFLSAPPKTYAPPAPYVGSPRYPANQQPKKGHGGDEPQPQSSQQQPQSVQPGAQTPASVAPMPLAQPAASEHRAPQPVVTQQPLITPEPAAVQQPAGAPAPTPANSKPDPKALKKQQETDRKAAAQQAVADKEAAKQKAAADKKQAEDNAREQKLLAERTRREQEVEKKNAELEKKRQEDEKKQEKAIADAAARLKAAQEAYQAEIDKKNKDKGGQ
jgi:colicin import membrane protein